MFVTNEVSRDRNNSRERIGGAAKPSLSGGLETGRPVHCTGKARSHRTSRWHRCRCSAKRAGHSSPFSCGTIRSQIANQGENQSNARSEIFALESVKEFSYWRGEKSKRFMKMNPQHATGRETVCRSTQYSPAEPTQTTRRSASFRNAHPSPLARKGPGKAGVGTTYVIIVLTPKISKLSVPR